MKNKQVNLEKEKQKCISKIETWKQHLNSSSIRKQDTAEYKIGRLFDQIKLIDTNNIEQILLEKRMGTWL